MSSAALAAEASQTELRRYREVIAVETGECLELTDLTDRVRDALSRSGVRFGFVNAQTRHTTTAVVVGEHEPLLIEDLKRALERLAPSHAAFRHDDFSIRTANLRADETKNGHAHCKALFLRTPESLNIADGGLDVGPWQRIFFVELDHGRPRTLSLMVFGEQG